MFVSSRSLWIYAGAILVSFVVWCVLLLAVFPPPAPTETTVETTVEEIVEVEKTVDQYVEVDIERAYQICDEQQRKAQEDYNDRVISGEIDSRETKRPPEAEYRPREDEEVGEDGVCRPVTQR